MAFWKRTKAKINGKWYPQSIIVGKPVSTTEIAKRISEQCTVTPADTRAVLVALGSVLGSFMKEGRSVKLDGVGTFLYTINARGNGVSEEKDVTSAQITDVRIRFYPEKHQNSSGKVISRTLASDTISWSEWGKESSGNKEEGDDEVVDPMV